MNNTNKKQYKKTRVIKKLTALVLCVVTMLGLFALLPGHNRTAFAAYTDYWSCSPLDNKYYDNYEWDDFSITANSEAIVNIPMIEKYGGMCDLVILYISVKKPNGAIVNATDASSTLMNSLNYGSSSLQLTSYLDLDQDGTYGIYLAVGYSYGGNDHIAVSYSTITSFSYEATVPLPPNPTKAGYDFGGWYYDAALTQPYDNAPIYGNTQLYAKFTPITYSITYNLNSGSMTGQTTTYTIESNTITYPTPSRNGYTFGGWYESSSFSGSPVTSIVKGSIGNKTVYAKWTAVTYSIIYNLNGGSISGQTTSYTIESNNLTYLTPTKTGYTFDGWYESSGFTGNAVTGITKGSTGNKTVYAKFTPITYTITYNLDGGELSGQTTTFTIENSTITLPTPTRIGYEFKGWYDNASFSGSAITSIPAGSTGNRTYYAKWEILKYTVTFYVDGEVYREMIVDYGTTFSGVYLVNVSTLEIVPLYTTSDMTTVFSADTVIAENMDIYTSSDFSIFVSLTYIVDGEELSTDLLEYNAPLNSLRTPAERDGYTFDGWYYDAAFTRAVEPTDKLTGNTTIYAKYIETAPTSALYAFQQFFVNWWWAFVVGAVGIAALVAVYFIVRHVRRYRL